MAENWKHLYEQMKKMVEMYQDEVVPGLRELLNQKWIPVTERLPDTFGEYIVAVLDVSGERYSDYADFDPYAQRWKTGLFLGVKDKVTHWMPLPEPPTEEARQDCRYNRNGHCTAQKLMPECDPQSCDRGNRHEMP